MRNMALLEDFYKICHKNLYPANLESLYSTWIPRSNKYFPESHHVVWFGLQGFLKEYIIDQFNEYFFEVDFEFIKEEYLHYIKNTFDENANADALQVLHELGYLPIQIKALPEGTLVPYRVPCMTIENTHKDFAWLTNWLESLLSCSLWVMSTTATVAHCFREILQEYIDLTSDNSNWKSVGCGDFSFRGMSSLESATTSGASFLTSFTKTSCIPAIKYLCEAYNADVTKEVVGNWSASVEHSCTTSNFQIDGDEETFFKKMCTEIYPNGNFSFVADSYDYFNFLDVIVRENKDLILARKGCIRLRPDSGDPLEIVCGTLKFKYFQSNREMVHFCKVIKEMNNLMGIEESRTVYGTIDNKYYKAVICQDSFTLIEEIFPTLEEKGSLNILWEIFGGIINSKGYRVLDNHIGLVYGDAITLERFRAMAKASAYMTFAVENVVYGVGSYSTQMRSRDSQGWALKATHGTVAGKEILIFKDPKTDDGIKKSPRGKMAVRVDSTGELELVDMLNTQEEIEFKDNLLETVFLDGTLIRDDSLSNIRNRIYNNNF